MSETPYPVKRLYDILPGTMNANDMAQAAITKALKAAGKDPTAKNPAASPWLFYKLIGSQFMGVNANKEAKLKFTPGNWWPEVDQSDNDYNGMSVYLSNSVIETNIGLQQFQGTPPGTNIISHYASKTASNTANVNSSDVYSGSISPNLGPYTTPSTLFGREDLNLAFGDIDGNGTAHGYNMGGCMGCHGIAQNRGYSFSFVLLGGQSGAGPDSELNFEIPPLQTDKNSLESFTGGFDSMAVIDGKTYVTRGPQFIRYSDSNGTTVDSGYPQPLTAFAGGLPEAFQQSFDSMAVLPNGYLYITKGANYVRYSDPTSRTAPDSGYPLPIKGEWGTLNKDFYKQFDSMAAPLQRIKASKAAVTGMVVAITARQCICCARETRSTWSRVGWATPIRMHRQTETLTQHGRKGLAAIGAEGGGKPGL